MTILDIPEVTEIGLYSYKTLPNKRIVWLVGENMMLFNPEKGTRKNVKIWKEKIT